jgi:hypothetical protein
VIILVAVVPLRDARASRLHARREHDDAPAIVVGNVFCINRSTIGDTDEIGAQFARLGLDLRRGQRPLENIHCRCLFLNS